MVETVTGAFVPVEDLAAEQRVTPEEIVTRIQNGELVGRKQPTGWHVMVQVRQPSPAQSPAAEPPGDGDVQGQSQGNSAGAQSSSTAQSTSNEPASGSYSRNAPAAAMYMPDPDEPQYVVLNAIRMGYWSLVWLWIKIVLAALPGFALAYLAVLAVTQPDQLIEDARSVYDWAKDIVARF